MRRIIINASDVAALAGYNPYTTKDQAMIKVLHRNPFLCPNKEVKIYSSYVEEKLSRLPVEEKKEINLLLDGVKNSLQKSIEESQEEQSRKIIKEIIKTTPSLAFLEDCMEQDIRIKRGILREKGSLNNLLCKSNDVLHILYIGHDVWIHGRIDGLTDNGTIVETKNRRSRFFEEIPLYEKVQMEVYMKMLNKEECLHVQNFNGEQKQVLYKKDPTLFSDCTEKVLDFIKNYSHI